MAGEIAIGRATTSNTGWTIRGRLQGMGINGISGEGYEIPLHTALQNASYEEGACEHYQTHTRVDGLRACDDCGSLVE
jgi:hypothetical protein